MSWSRIAFLALLSLTVPPTAQLPHEEPLPAGELRPDGDMAERWTHRTTEVRGVRVRLNGLGARTHANWVLFRLPFDATQRQRLRAVRFSAGSRAPSAVGALRIGSVCMTIPSSGGVDAWSLYTMSGVGRTERYRWHPSPPTDDPTIVGLNVPTRVANYVACGWGEGYLRDPENWSLQIDWEER
jgi:hypothetical protein